MRLSSLLLGTGLAVLLATTATAATIDVSVTGFSETHGSATQTGSFEATDVNGDGIFEYDFSDLPSNIGSTGRWSFDEWGGSVNPDPVISNGFSVVNLLPTTQTFTITLTTVTGPIGAPTTLTGGSAQGGVSDGNGGGATLSTSGAGTAFYTSLIDGGAFVSLYSDPSSVTVPGGGSGNLSPVEDFGLPIPPGTFPGPAVLNSIGIQFQFDVSGGDRATGSGTFSVEPIPEPATALLLVLGLAALSGARRRRR